MKHTTKFLYLFFQSTRSTKYIISSFFYILYAIINKWFDYWHLACSLRSMTSWSTWMVTYKFLAILITYLTCLMDTFMLWWIAFVRIHGSILLNTTLAIANSAQRGFSGQLSWAYLPRFTSMQACLSMSQNFQLTMIFWRLSKSPLLLYLLSR